MSVGQHSLIGDSMVLNVCVYFATNFILCCLHLVRGGVAADYHLGHKLSAACYR